MPNSRLDKANLQYTGEGMLNTFRKNMLTNRVEIHAESLHSSCLRSNTYSQPSTRLRIHRSSLQSRGSESCQRILFTVSNQISHSRLGSLRSSLRGRDSVFNSVLNIDTSTDGENLNEPAGSFASIRLILELTAFHAWFSFLTLFVRERFVRFFYGSLSC